MPKTRAQKEEALKDIKRILQEDGGFIALGFTKATMQALNGLRSQLMNAGGAMRVVKRRLFANALKDANIAFELVPFLGQTAVITFAGTVSDVAGVASKFLKSVEGKMFGGLVAGKEALTAEYVSRVGELPSREVLLSQLVGALSGPMRALVYVLDGVRKKST